MMTVEARLRQREDARAKANAVRIARAAIKREIKGGTRDIRAVVLDPPPYCLNMEIEDLLVALPRVRYAVAQRIMVGICRPTLQLQHMSIVTRRRLVEAIEERAWWAFREENAA